MDLNNFSSRNNGTFEGEFNEWKFYEKDEKQKMRINTQ